MKQVDSLSNNHTIKEYDMTHITNISDYKIDTRAVARRLILAAAIASSLNACGVKMGSGVVLGTTSFLEEVNRGTHTEVLQERITGQDRARLQAKLDEVQ